MKAKMILVLICLIFLLLFDVFAHAMAVYKEHNKPDTIEIGNNHIC